jgi:hypothetical protein
VLTVQTDPDDSQYTRVVAYPPDGSMVVAWHEADAEDTVYVRGLRAGPLDPAEIQRGLD